jgi:hypothetical protein
MSRACEQGGGHDEGLATSGARRPAPGARVSNPAFLGLAFVLALAIRMLPFAAASDGELRLLSPDCYGHLRRATAVARGFPRVPVFDPYLNHPDGGIWIWPPAFDLLIGGVARGSFGPDVRQEDVAWVAALLPPLLGALQLFPLAALARRVLSRRRARLAVAAVAVLPSAALWGCFGHADHHVAEVLALLLVLSSAAVAADARLPARRQVVWAAVTGALLALAVLTWQGAVFVAALVLPWAALALPGTTAVAGLVATSLVWAVTTLTLGGLQVPFTYVSFGYFQPVFLAVLTVPLALLAAWRARGAHRRVGWGGVALALLVAAAPYLPELGAAVVHGSGYVAGLSGSRDTAAIVHGGYLAYPESFLGVVAEARPLLRAPLGPAAWRALTSFSPGLLLLPFALVFWTGGRRCWQRLGSRGSTGKWRGRQLLALLGAAVLVMGLLQQRMGYYLAPFAALALGEGVARAPWRRLQRRAWLEVGAVLLLLGALGWSPLRDMAAYRAAPGPDFLGLLRTLRVADPPGVDPADWPPPAPGAVAGVMGPWAAGHFVTALAGRPAAADPFAYGWWRQCRLFTATDPEEVETILRQARCRYLLTADLRGVLPAYAAAAGRSGLDVERMAAVRIHESGDPRPLPFLDLVLQSRHAHRLANGRLVPDFRIWRVLPPGAGGSAAP